MLWALVSVNIVGAAFLFRRLFPKESPWLGFIVPEIIFVLGANFIEHRIALTWLWALFLITTISGIWAIADSRNLWRVMRLPSLLFIGIFAFTLLLRCLKPSIPHVRDGIPDLSLISAFLMGQTLPVDSTWIPPVKLVHYYYLEHYAASLVVRLFSVDIGTGFNICAALLATYIYFFTAGVAWHLTKGRLRLTLLALFLTICAGTGSTAYLWFGIGDQMNPDDFADVYNRLINPNFHLFLWKFLDPIVWSYDRHDLMVPGYWSWMGCYHSASAGQLLICFSIFSVVEMLRRKAVLWPWICAAIAPLLMLTCCSWGMPLAGLFFLCGLYVCWRRKIVPSDWRMVVAIAIGTGICLEPMLSYMFLWAAPPIELNTLYHTQLAEFFIQWWPVYLPWLVLLFAWKRLHPAVQISLVLTPLAFTVVEIFNVGQRYDMTGKLWGMIYGAGWILFIPALLMQRGKIFRVVLALVFLESIISLGFWMNYYWRTIEPKDIAHLEGYGPLRWDLRKARILEAMSQMKYQTVLPGRSDWAFCEAPALAHFTLNRAYVTYSVITDFGFYTNGLGEGYKREVPVNDLYAGKCDNPLVYLRQRNINAVVIYPDDEIPDDVVQKLERQLAPYYTFEDYRDYKNKGETQNAGIFIYHPELTSFPASVLTPVASP